MDGKISGSMYESVLKTPGVKDVYPNVSSKEKIYAGKKNLMSTLKALKAIISTMKLIFS